MDDHPICGVYRIHCKTLGISYIGATRNVGERWKQHLATIKKGKLVRTIVPNDISDYSLEIIEECQEDALIQREYIHIRNAIESNEILFNKSLKSSLKRVPLKTPLRPGRHGIPLTDYARKKLLKIMETENLTIGSMADKIGISRAQLDYPLHGGRCSVDSHQKIHLFLEQNQGKK
jgi:predicted GIY-YIG superfamily endonuclease